MSLEPDLKGAFQLVVRACGAVLWCIGTVWLGVRMTLGIIAFVRRLRAILSDVLPCPRGHRIPTYGVFECGCGALHEGWVFGPCRVCGLSAGWTPCLACGLPVRSPVLA